MKFKVGDKVKAVNNKTIFTSERMKWEGVVTKTTEDGFSAKTTKHLLLSVLDVEFDCLDYNDFELETEEKAKEESKTRKPFRVGQLVQIKDWCEMEREYGLDRSGDILCNPCFVMEMKPLCGEFAEITDILGASVRLKFFNFDGDTDWCYSTDMIKPIKEKEK